MTAQPLARATAPAMLRAWRAPLAALGTGLVLLALAFHDEIASAVAVWISSTAYNHCFLVLPIAAWLAWERRERMSEVPIRPAEWAVVVAVPLTAAWFLAERLGVMEGRQLAALGCVELLFLVTLGWRFCRAFAVPLLYLIFLVPFGAFLVPRLQDITAAMAVAGLNLIGIPNYADGRLIQIREGTFLIAEACAGLRFLIASIAFGVLYACTIYRSPLRRTLFIAASVIVPILANGMRALGIIVLGHVLGSAEAAAADHVIYGWVFFSLVILLLVLAGLPFREAPKPFAPLVASVGVTARGTGTAWFAAAAATAVILSGPVLAGRLERMAEAEPVSSAPPAPATPASCAPLPGDADRDAQSRGVRAILRRYDCDGMPILLRVETFSPRTGTGTLLAAARRASGELDDAEANVTALDVPGAVPERWRLVETERPERTIASALWIGGTPAEGWRMRVRQAWNSLAGTAGTPILVAIEAESRGGAAEDALRRFIEAGWKGTAP